MSRLSRRQSHNEIHSNLFPLPLKYLQRLQHSSGSFMLILDSLTGDANGNILDNISLHSISLIGCLDIMVHLIPSRMNGISGLVSLTKYLILQFLDVRHTNPSFVLQYTLVVFCKSGQLLFLDIVLSLLNLLIFT
jgi:hypothetical protein